MDLIDISPISNELNHNCDDNIYEIPKKDIHNADYQYDIPIQEDDEACKNGDDTLNITYSHQQAFKSNYQLVNTWEGIVTEVDGESIYAKLYDTSDGTYDEYEFDIEDIDNEEQNLIEVGTLFMLYLGYYTNPKGTKMKSSHIKIRRIPIDLDEVNNTNLNFNNIWE